MLLLLLFETGYQESHGALSEARRLVCSVLSSDSERLDWTRLGWTGPKVQARDEATGVRDGETAIEIVMECVAGRALRIDEVT